MIINDFLQDALKALIPQFPNWYTWVKTDEDGNVIVGDQRMQTKHVIVTDDHKDKVTRPTDKEINDKVAELKADYESKQYQRNRAELFDPIPEQLDQIYHDMDGWRAKIKAVKDKYPKP